MAAYYHDELLYLVGSVVIGATVLVGTCYFSRPKIDLLFFKAQSHEIGKRNSFYATFHANSVMCLAQLSDLKKVTASRGNVHAQKGHTHSLGNDTTGAEEDIITMIAYSGHINTLSASRLQIPLQLQIVTCKLQTR
ncbi:hypothetical protein N7530_000214 [Penicillium desertorum]|uniref:Uncharacterized protein n=1 Tax=Penicillium desertorum TaxID=1303715 RepID=A0A9W9X880_9EURO|nr:hypothetical protein N7530_000214 [Penicillium desertorum]